MKRLLLGLETLAVLLVGAGLVALAMLALGFAVRLAYYTLSLPAPLLALLGPWFANAVVGRPTAFGVLLFYFAPAATLGAAAVWLRILWVSRRRKARERQAHALPPADTDPAPGPLPPSGPGRNIVIFCDGTSNEFCTNNTNVVKLYQMLGGSEIRFYDPGVGTFASAAALLPISKRATMILGLATGYGLMTTVEQAYAFLMNTWQPGDNIYIFGFSRGAYTSRVVAAMLHAFGLLPKGQEHLIPYASKMLETFTPAQAHLLSEFKDTFGRPCDVRFLGLWDTVTSYGWAWSPKTLPFTRNNPSVQIVRHAIAIDERRAFFRQNLWGSSGNVKQVWFAGVHSDIGGSYVQAESGLSQITLQWMWREAKDAGLRLDAVQEGRILSTPPPALMAKMHDSMTWYWKPAELYPKEAQVKVGPNTYEMSYRFNCFRPRAIPEGSLIHTSVVQRIAAGGYTPALPKRFVIES